MFVTLLVLSALYIAVLCLIAQRQKIARDRHERDRVRAPQPHVTAGRHGIGTPSVPPG